MSRVSNDDFQPMAFLFDHTGDDGVQIVRMADQENTSKYWTPSEPLYAETDIPYVVEFIIDRLVAANAIDENGADKLRREVDEEFGIYGDVAEKKGGNDN